MRKQVNVIGSHFLHRHWLDANKQPLRCVITRCANGGIYWRAADGGDTYWFDNAYFDRYVKEMLA
jgi:hypothetical protein